MHVKICSIIGARPQFIKASPLSLELKKHFEEVIIHTGQHYDFGMSDIFFEELSIPSPKYHLGIGSGLHGEQTGGMLQSIEKVLMDEKPGMVLVYGDTNSTLAGALAASKLHIPVVHVEAGLRSFNKQMPEEINRILTDHVSDFLFVPSDVSKNNLQNEGITENVFNVGDIMYDAIVTHSKRASVQSNILGSLEIQKETYLLSTIHRAENTDNIENLQNIFEAFSRLKLNIILPLHPRTRRKIEEFKLKLSENVIITNPLGYLDMVNLMQNSLCILTDSGGIQKEAYYLNVPCVTMREETEWTETVDAGWNVIAGTSIEKIIEGVSKSKFVKTFPHPALYGEGNTAKLITDILIKNSLKEEICAA